MSERKLNVDENLQNSYSDQYSDRMTDWRELDGKYKVKNILKVCQGLRLREVLDFGAGQVNILKYSDIANIFPKFYVIEISENVIAQIKKREIHNLEEIKKFEGGTIPCPDRHFDMAYYSNVIEHAEHLRFILRELKRTGYHQAFEIPLDYSIGLESSTGYFLSYDHINIFKPSLFKFLLKSEGYEIINEKFSHADPEIIRYINANNINHKPSQCKELKSDCSHCTG